MRSVAHLQLVPEVELQDVPLQEVEFVVRFALPESGNIDEAMLGAYDHASATVTIRADATQSEQVWVIEEFLTRCREHQRDMETSATIPVLMVVGDGQVAL